MTIVTHVPFGLLTAEFACSSFGYEMDGPALGLAALGALLPDIDHPRSSVGFLFSFTGIPQYLERRIGHRTVTHSWIFLLGSLVLFIPIWFAWGLLYYLSAWFGVLSHILIDMANVQGVPLFWPERSRWVFPAAERYRIIARTPPEFILAAILMIVTTAFTPISIIGMRSAFYLLTRDVYSAAREARRFFPENELTCQIRGTWRDTLLPVDYEEKFRVVAVEQSNIYFARNDAVFATGGASPALTIDRILVQRDRPTVRVAQSVEIDHQLLDEIADRLPDRSIITGTLVASMLTEDQKSADYVTASEEFATVRHEPRDRETENIVITYCPAERLRKALLGRGIFVLHGVLTVTTSTAPGDKGSARPAP